MHNVGSIHYRSRMHSGKERLHSGKDQLHSGMPSPSATLGEARLGNRLTVKPLSPRAENRTLGKASSRGVKAHGEEFFVFFKKIPNPALWPRHCGPLRPVAHLCAVAVAVVGGRHRPPLCRLCRRCRLSSPFDRRHRLVASYITPRPEEGVEAAARE
jgi:hypothetical protein